MTKWDMFYKEACNAMQKDAIDDTFKMDDADSLTRVELIVIVENTFNIQLSNAEIIALKTFGDLDKLVKSKAND